MQSQLVRDQSREKFDTHGPISSIPCLDPGTCGDNKTTSVLHVTVDLYFYSLFGRCYALFGRYQGSWIINRVYYMESCVIWLVFLRVTFIFFEPERREKIKLTSKNAKPYYTYFHVITFIRSLYQESMR